VLRCGGALGLEVSADVGTFSGDGGAVARGDMVLACNLTGGGEVICIFVASLLTTAGAGRVHHTATVSCAAGVSWVFSVSFRASMPFLFTNILIISVSAVVSDAGI
jgi:hypothetical protein